MLATTFASHNFVPPPTEPERSHGEPAQGSTVGLGVTPMGKIYGRRAVDLAAEAIALALEDAGLNKERHRRPADRRDDAICLHGDPRGLAKTVVLVYADAPIWVTPWRRNAACTATGRARIISVSSL